MARESSLQELLVAAFESQTSNMYTSIPCVVVAIRDSLNGQMVDIQPTINQKFVNGEIKERTPILGVPVSFQVTKKSGLTFPIRVGDTGLAVFSMRNLDVWKAGLGLPGTPANAAKMDKGDAIFIPGIQPPSVAVNNPNKRTWTHSTEDTVLVHNIGESTETEVRLLAGGGIVINTNQDAEINCNNASITAQGDIDMQCTNFTLDATGSITMTATTGDIAIGNTTWSGNIIQTGNYTLIGVGTFNGVDFSTHGHTDVQPGIGISGGPVNL